jgi:hypothetical protein
MAGYSATPLIKKLGIKEGCILYVHNPPMDYFSWIGPLPDSVVVKSRIGGKIDFIHLFVMDGREFKKQFKTSQKHLNTTGMLWVSWPKRASNIPTDLDENIIRGFGLQQGLVDIKVCAVNEVWSGLKFVIRVEDR